jgi:hypothetical protein
MRETLSMGQRWIFLERMECVTEQRPSSGIFTERLIEARLSSCGWQYFYSWQLWHVPVGPLLRQRISSRQAQSSPATPLSIFDSGGTTYGFFPSSPEITAESLMVTIEAIGQHGDIILNMPQVPWADFIESPEAESQATEDMRGSIELARQHRLEVVFVIDPLQAFDRRVIATMPDELAGGDFSTPGVRRAFMNYAKRLVREFHPRYLGLVSEINTYADVQPEDFSNYVTLYHETYAAIKAIVPNTLVFVTIQWEDLKSVGLFSQDSPGVIKWDIVDQFEPNLDVYAISTYPYFAFEGAAQIPEDYYSPLLSRTSKPLAIAEGGFLSQDVGAFRGSTQDQIDYLHTIDGQLGECLAFWIYLIIDDVNTEAYAHYLTEHGSPAEEESLALFGYLGLRTKDGEPKPALGVRDGFRSGE